MTESKRTTKPRLEVKVDYSRVRFTDSEKAIIEEYASRLYYTDPATGKKMQYARVYVVKVHNYLLQLFTYIQGVEHHTYRSCDNFESKAFFMGYCKGCVAMASGNKDLLK